jgi:hypothetical protein
VSNLDANPTTERLKNKERILLYEIHKKSAQHDQDEIYRKEALNQDHIFGGYLLDVLLSELSKIK